MTKNNKVCLIIDPSEAFLRSKTQEIFTEWGFKRTNVKELNEWQFIPKAPSLFGDLLMTHLDLTGKGTLKAFADLISQRKMQESFKNDEWYGNGVIITATTAQGTKKIEKLVSDSGGFIIKKEKSGNRKREMFSTLNLSSEVKTAIDSYVGEDYDLMLSFTNEVGKLSKDEQRKMTPEMAFSYIPPTPGSVLPWDYINALMNGNTNESIQLFNRTLNNTHILVCLVFLTKKMQLMYRVKSAMILGFNSDKQIAEAIGEKASWELSSVVRVARRISIDKVEQIALITNKLESDIKGGSQVDPTSLFLVALTKIGILMGNR